VGPSDSLGIGSGMAQSFCHLAVSLAAGAIPQRDDGSATEAAVQVWPTEWDAGAGQAAAAEALSGALQRPRLVAPAALRQVNAWIGRCRTSHLHFDGLDNLLTVLEGSKTVHLYRPEELTSLYPQLQESERWKSAARSRLYLRRAGGGTAGGAEEEEQEEEEAFPLLRSAPFVEAELRRGEMLYIPAGWWHEVFTPTATLAVNYWFVPHPVARFRPTILYLHSDEYAQRCLEEARARSAQPAQASAARGAAAQRAGSVDRGNAGGSAKRAAEPEALGSAHADGHQGKHRRSGEG